MFSKITMAVAATMLVAAPVAAAPVSPNNTASVTKSVRAGSPTKDQAKLAGGGGIIVAILAAAAIGLGIYVAVDNDDKADSN